jgi:hypothetical protein
MISVSEIQEQLKAFVGKVLPLDQLEDWLVEKSWNMHTDSDPVAQAMVSFVELRLAEHSAGHLPAEQMIHEFRALLAGHVVLDVPLNVNPASDRSGSSISIQRVQVLAPSGERESLRVYG